MNIYTHKKAWIIIVLIAIILPISIHYYPLSNEDSGVKIGAIFNMTGYGAFAGEESRNGLTLALEDSEFPTKQVVVEDGQSDLKSIVSGINKLVHTDRVQAIVGPEWTEFGAVAAPLGVQYQIPIISPWVVADSDFVKPPYFWSMTPSDIGEHRALAEYLANHNVKKVALIKTDNTWSQINTRELEQELVQKKIEYREYTTSPNQTDFRTEILKIKDYNPDIVYSAIADDAGHAILCGKIFTMIPDMRAATHSARAKSDSTIKKLGALSSKIIFAQMNSADKEKEFNEKYKSRFGSYPTGPSAAATYDAIMILIHSIRSGNTSSAQLIQSISQADFTGYSGDIKFDSNGKLPIRKALIYRLDDQHNPELIS
jgi:branched-chain amino acid transport system substrate-binding protein